MPPRRIDWEHRIGRRLRLRDLHVFSTVVQCGSMAKAAAELGVAQPTVSEVIADLEHTYGVRLLDRGPQGVAPNIYGDALLKRSIAAFDELKQSGRDIEFLADPATGEVRVGSVQSLAVTILPQIILRFAQQYPGIVTHFDDLLAPATDLPGLHDRKYDCILLRLVPALSEARLPDDVKVDFLFNDKLVVAAGINSRWARRRKIDLAELVDEPWLLPSTDTWNYSSLVEAFRARGLAVPKANLVSVSLSLRTQLMAAGPYLSVFARSVMQLNAHRFQITILPIELPVRPWPVVIATLKHRTLSPVVERFIACTHEVAQAFAAGA
jgi:DNA-binding transcriptional LysR family regulator